MKKSMMCGLMMSVSLFSISAYAADGDNALTTKKYVNDGLSFVYGVANGTENGAVKDIKAALSDGNNGLINVGNLANAVGAKGTGGATGTGLAGEVQSLQNTIGDATNGLVKKVNDLEASSNVYTAGTGVVVTPGENDDPTTIGIAVPSNAQNGAKYVFQSNGAGGGTWTQMEVADTWSSDFLTGGN